jgi:hypothetical protein
LSVDAVAEGLLLLEVFDLVDVRIILIKDVNLASIHELAVTADGTFGIFVADEIDRVATLELVKYNGSVFLVVHHHVLLLPWDAAIALRRHNWLLGVD